MQFSAFGWTPGGLAFLIIRCFAHRRRRFRPVSGTFAAAIGAIASLLSIGGPPSVLVGIFANSLGAVHALIIYGPEDG